LLAIRDFAGKVANRAATLLSYERMPTYEYACQKCGEHFEQLQAISAKPLATCPKEVCRQTPWGKGKVKRVISGGAGLIFKGSGFYITDYRSDKYKEAAKKEAPAPAASGTDAKGSGGDTKAGASKPEKKAGSLPSEKN